MKKKISFSIISLLLILSLSACGKSIIYDALFVTVGDTNTLTYSVKDVFGGSKSTYFDGAAVTSDGGYVAIGNTIARDGDCEKINDNYKDSVGVAIKYDKDHKIKWKKFFGAESDVKFNDIAVTSDGGCIIIGYTTSKDLTGGNYGLNDGLIIKLNAKGKTEFIKHFGGNDEDVFKSISVCPDGGFVICGRTNSNDHDLAKQGNPENDALLVKFNALGEKQWLKVFGGTSSDSFERVSVDKDGQIFVLCNTTSYNEDMDDLFQGSVDCLVMKYDSGGKQIWQENYSGRSTDIGNALVATNDGGCIIGGSYVKNSYMDGIFKGQYYYDKKDAFAVKINKDGSIKWVNSFGGSEDEEILTILPAKNGFIVTGSTTSSDGIFASVIPKGKEDVFVAFYDMDGKVTLLSNFGGSQADYIYSTRIFSGEVLFAGFSVSNDYDLKGVNNQAVQRGIVGTFKIN